MATTATVDDINRMQVEVDRHEAEIICTRQEIRNGTAANTDAGLDSLAAHLVEVKRLHRIAASILGDMKAGAGDFHDWDADNDDTL